jgi:hypothetical protein
MPREHDIVRLTQARLDHSLPAGAVGTVVHVFEAPNLAFEVEFCDAEGRTIAQLPLLPHEIEPADIRQPV